MAPFLWAEKRGEERGEVYKKEGNDIDRNTENPANLIPAKYHAKKTAGNNVIQL